MVWTGLLAIARAIDRVNGWAGRLSGWLLPLLVVLGTWNVAGRYVGRAVGVNLASNALLEGQWYLFDLIFLVGAGYTLRQDAHVRVDVLYSRWSPRWQAVANLAGAVLFLIPFCLLVAVTSWQAVVDSWTIRELSPDPGGLPRYPVKALVLVFCLLLILQGLAEIIQNLARLLGHLPLDETTTDAGLEL